MSATIYWKPKKNGTALKVDSPSSLLEALENLFGSGPWTLTHSELTVLHTAAKLNPHEEGWQDLADAVERSGEIEVTAANW